MNEKIQAMLGEITAVRESKYQAEIKRQFDAIEEALKRFLEQTKNNYEGIVYAMQCLQTKNKIYFNYKLDVDVLPEVAERIKDEFGLEINPDDRKSIFGSFEV